MYIFFLNIFWFCLLQIISSDSALVNTTHVSLIYCYNTSLTPLYTLCSFSSLQWTQWGHLSQLKSCQHFSTKNASPTALFLLEWTAKSITRLHGSVTFLFLSWSFLIAFRWDCLVLLSLQAQHPSDLIFCLQLILPHPLQEPLNPT